MNILLIGHSYVVALNRRICRELALAGAGINVTVAAPSFYHGDLQPLRLGSSDGDGEPYRLEPVGTRFSKIPHIFFYSRQLQSLLREQSWDVVHAWEEPYILASAQIAFHTRPGASLIFSSFQNLPKRYPPPFSGIERYCLSKASGWTAFGQTVAETLRDRPGYRKRPMVTIPPGVDVNVFRPDADARRVVFEKLGWSASGPPVVGFLGRFVSQKGVELLQRALDRLDPSSWRALWVGGGPLEEPLRKWAEPHGDRVRIVTGVAHDGVPAYLNAMDLLAAPSQTTPRWREQFGRMLVEAMAAGVPVVASRSGEIPHVVADAGRIVAEADETAWVTEFRDLIDSPDRREELRVRGLARAREVYAWPVIACKYLEFYQRLREPGLRIAQDRTADVQVAGAGPVSGLRA